MFGLKWWNQASKRNVTCFLIQESVSRPGIAEVTSTVPSFRNPLVSVPADVEPLKPFTRPIRRLLWTEKANFGLRKICPPLFIYSASSANWTTSTIPSYQRPPSLHSEIICPVISLKVRCFLRGFCAGKEAFFYKIIDFHCFGLTQDKLLLVVNYW